MTDIVTFGPGEPPRRPSRRLIVAGLVLLTAVAGGTAAAVMVRRSPSPPPAVSIPTCRPAPDPAGTVAPVALVIDCAARTGGSLDRRDPTASRGPWTVVVRRHDGSLGRNGAVVTFPAAAAPPAAAASVDVGGAPGRAGPGTVTWPVGGAFARVRGDLPQPALLAIAAATTVAAGRPAVDPPAGYAVAGRGTYRSPATHEIRYGTADLGEQDALSGGLTYTGVTGGGGFEDQLYAVPRTDGGPVGGRPSVVSSVAGGNGSLAWEPAPGVVAYVGYSGAVLDDHAAAALQRLAERTRPLDEGQWQSRRPHRVEQVDEPG